MPNNKEQSHTVRPPVVAIMGHVDHGKSSLLDYLRTSNIVAGEAGGITQHIAAYEIKHKDPEGNTRKITFIDTPGHAAFTGMRTRGAQIADIAILIVSAEDSVKEQTIEAIRIIKENNVPFVVAISKIDKPNANIAQVKNDLMLQEIYVEGMGGDIPVAEISSKTGAGIDELLEILLLVADLEELTGEPNAPATGFIIESHLDEKRGISATAIIKNGTLQKKQFVVSGEALVATRMMEDFLGKSIESATFSSPIILTGFSKLPRAGEIFSSYTNKKDAEKALMTSGASSYTLDAYTETEGATVIPLVIKTDVAGTQDAVIQEINKLSNTDVIFKIIKTGIGTINESDVQTALCDASTIIVGFNVDVDKKAMRINDYDTLTIQTFDIIYKLIEWLDTQKEVRREKKQIDEVSGRIKILKFFSTNKNKHVVGGTVTLGPISKGVRIKIMRDDTEICQGKITGFQQAKAEVASVSQDSECGIMLESPIAPDAGDSIEVFTTVTK
jgi:translation initiation factor IF-2